MKSKLNLVGNVSFPEFTGERVYQALIKKDRQLPVELQRWQQTVDSMLSGVEVDGAIYLTIDQGYVDAGCTQRREGPHIDGNWYPSITAHGQPGPPHHSFYVGSHGGGGHRLDLDTVGGLILACDRDGAKVYKGEFYGVAGDGGDCSHMDLSGAEIVILNSNQAYLGNLTMIHEAMPAQQSGPRTLVRLNMPELAA